MRIILLLLLGLSLESHSIDYETFQSLKCSKYFQYYEIKYLLPQDSLHAIALQESGLPHPEHKKLIPWPWAINVAGKSHYLMNKAQAVRFVKKKLSEGVQNIDVGCMQINLKYHGQYFSSIEHAFDPQSNISYAAYFLNQQFQQTQDWTVAIAHYHSKQNKLGSRYSQLVFQIAKRLERDKAYMQTNQRDLLD